MHTEVYNNIVKSIMVECQRHFFSIDSKRKTKTRNWPMNNKKIQKR